MIESQFKLLLDKIDSQHDFEAVRLAHEHFVIALMAQSLLLMKPIARCLIEILSLCHRFCRLVGGEQLEELTDERDEQRLVEVTKVREVDSPNSLGIFSSSGIVTLLGEFCCVGLSFFLH